MFQGFSQETIDFMWGIRFHNRRDWFLEHKEIYQKKYYEPMKELGAEVQERFHQLHPEFQLNVKVSRIYRDARIVRDGRPYKDHLWLVLREAAEGSIPRPAYYAEFYPEHYEFGMGYWCPKPALMEHFRAKALREQPRLEKLAHSLNRQKQFRLYGTLYKKPKAEVSALLNPWLNRRDIGISCEKDYEEGSPFFGAELIEEIVEGFDYLAPFFQFFQELAMEPEEGYKATSYKGAQYD